MTVTLDLQGKASPIINEARIAEWVWKFFKFNPLQYVQTHFKKKLDELILPIEGFLRHINELAKEDAEELLAPTRKIIRIFDKYDQLLALSEYAQDVQLKEKYKYLLKTLYRLESLLHIQATKDIPVEKTPDYIREGIVGISRASVHRIQQ